VNSILRAFLAGLILAALPSGLATAQSFDFNLLLTASNGSAGTIANNSTVNLVGQLNTQTQVTITATYAGNTQATISSNPNTWLLGSNEFKVALANGAMVPLVLNPGQSFSFAVTFDPTNATGASAQVTIFYTEPGTTTATVTNAIVVLFNGITPLFQLSYSFPPPNDNVIAISPGGTIPFPATQINTTATAQLNISNLGSGPGTITAISQPAASSPFKLSGLPLLTLGYALAAGDNLPIEVLYTPTAVENDTAQIVITYQGGVTATVILTGSGTTSSFTYGYLSGAGTTPTPVKAGGTITMPPVNVGSTSTVIVQVTNTGNASGTINSISLSGQGFQLVNPPATPPTLQAGGTTNFTISFTPSQPGTQTGQLVVGSDVFTLSGEGLGPALTFSYISSAGTITVTTGGAVDFIPVAISQSEKVTFVVTNSGTSTATISNISTSAPFSLTPAPALPLILAPGKSSQFGITFTPVSTAAVTGTLLIDSTQVELLGSGTAPPALPSYTFTGPSGNASPASQPGVGLTLASSYPVDLDGVLTLTTSGSVGTDPNAEFSTGNRTVDFVIPANSTSANFAGEGSQILLQTGTVAETVTLTPSFATGGGVDVTPAAPTTLQFTVPSVAPFLVSAQIANETSNSFELVLIGYSTTRSLTSLSVTFNPASGFKIGTAQLTIDLTQVSAAWFQSSASIAFGGQFQITAPFTLQGTPPKNQTLIESIASVTATVGNAVGTSGSLQAGVQ